MRRHSRRVVAAVAAALTIAVATTAGNAHRHRQLHAAPQPSVRAGPPPTIPASSPPITATAPSSAPVPPTRTDAGKSGAPAVTFDPQDLHAVLGKDVRSSTDEDMGRLVDVVVDRNGQPRAAVIDFGGFLGVGSRKIAVDWTALNFARGAAKGVITVELTRDQLKATPEFKEGSPVVVLGALGQPAPQPPPQPPPQSPDK
jgi:PRC-barrel domain protein